MSDDYTADTGPEPAWSEDEITRRLNAAIEAALNEHGVRLGGGNQIELPRLVGDAAAAIVQESTSPERRELQTQVGQQAYQRLIGTMVTAGNELGVLPEVGERTYELAVARLGRFPPFW